MDKNISRRNFLKIVGVGAAGAVLPSCVKSSDKDDNLAAPESREIKGKMTYRHNPNTGDDVSILGYGCMRFPTVSNESARESDSDIDQDAVNRLIDYALEHGVNYFDTSPAYCKGFSEQATGIALARHPRDKYFIATKISNFAPETWPHDRSVAMFENSLKQLQTDYIDYLLLHAIGGGGRSPIDDSELSGMEVFEERYIKNGMLDYLVEQKAKGRIRNLGFSYHGDIAVFNHALEMHDNGEIHWDFVQIQLNYIDWFNPENKGVNLNVDAEHLYNELHKRVIPAVIMEPLLGGRLANTTKPIMTKMLQRRPNDSVATWAFRFAGTPEGVLTVLSGMTYMEHLQDNLATFCPLEPINDDEMAFLEQATKDMLSHPLIGCTACQYCMPCPYGLDIPGIFAHYNKCVNEDNYVDDNRSPRYVEARKAFLVGYDRSIPRLRQADHCIGCGACVSHCPQRINIPEQMHKIDEYVTKLKANKS